MPMNLNQITAFRAVMNSGSISQAARKIGRTQPAVSLAIKALEEDLGVELFRRQGRQLVPVPEAHYLLIEAEAILDRMATVSRTMKSLASGRTGSLNVSAMPGATYLFSRYVSQMTGPKSDVTISISARSSTQILELAGSQSIDFGFGDAPVNPPPNATYQTEVITADCMCAVSNTHPLARKERIAFTDLDGAPLGVLQKGHTHHVKIRDRFSRAGIGFDTVIDSQTFLPLLPFVHAGFCIAIVDPLTVITEGDLGWRKGEVEFRPLVEPIRYDYAIVSPRHRPLSQMALAVRSGWRNELMRLLESVGARPEISKADTRVQK